MPLKSHHNKGYKITFYKDTLHIIIMECIYTLVLFGFGLLFWLCKISEQQTLKKNNNNNPHVLWTPEVVCGTRPDTGEAV